MRPIPGRRAAHRRSFAVNNRRVAALLLVGMMFASACGGDGAGAMYQTSRDLADALGCTDFEQFEAGAGDSGSCNTWGGAAHPPGSSIAVAVQAEEGWDLAKWRQTQVDVARESLTEPGDCAVLLIGENWRISVGTCRQTPHDLLLATSEALKTMVGGSGYDITP